MNYIRWGKAQHQVVSMPFITENGTEATLWMPRDGITSNDAERLKAMIDTLVIDREPQP